MSTTVPTDGGCLRTADRRHPYQCGANGVVILAQAAIRDAFKEMMGRKWGGMWLNAAQMAV